MNAPNILLAAASLASSAASADLLPAATPAATR